MRLAANSAPAVVKRRAVKPVNKVKLLPVYSGFIYVTSSSHDSVELHYDIGTASDETLCTKIIYLI
jgi:hypothetical protein